MQTTATGRAYLTASHSKAGILKTSMSASKCKMEPSAGGGPLARLSYVGPVNKHDFKNFELKIEVMAKPGSNGGVFFHTGPQSKFLKKGYEAQDKPEACSSLRISTRHP